MPRSFRRKATTATVALGLMISLASCAVMEPPRASLAAADLAVKSAEKAVAPQSDDAALSSARRKLSEARAIVEKPGRDARWRYEKARQLAEQVVVDAQLAEARARAEAAQGAAREVEEAVDRLRARLGTSEELAPRSDFSSEVLP